MKIRQAGFAAVAVAALAATGVAIAQSPAAKAPMSPAPAARSGYLGETAPDTYKILPPAPTAGTIRYQADRSTFLATRSLKDTPRWALAQNDDNSRGLIKDLACAVGVELTPQNAPRTSAMILKLAPDVSWATNHPKDIYKRPRPYLVDEGPICIEKTAALAASPDYPSGHGTWSWTVGLVMAELVPDRATEILVRARAFGESRLVCGVHTMSAVESARSNASILVAGLHGSAAFRKDLDAARLEIAKARAAGPAPDPVACAAEAELTKASPYN
ncbi:MAG TPA: phosphatase PAP2 family protein [Phenylobacterium sp.]|nr:phosphatase PAP2 family protein [Phenylobacterium sp.]